MDIRPKNHACPVLPTLISMDAKTRMKCHVALCDSFRPFIVIISHSGTCNTGLGGGVEARSLRAIGTPRYHGPDGAGRHWPSGTGPARHPYLRLVAPCPSPLRVPSAGSIGHRSWGYLRSAWSEQDGPNSTQSPSSVQHQYRPRSQQPTSHRLRCRQWIRPLYGSAAPSSRSGQHRPW